MLERWWRPQSIKFTRPQIIWLLNHLPDIWKGKWPAYPKDVELSNADAPLPEWILDTQETQEMIESIHQELVIRLENTGWDGILLLENLPKGQGRYGRYGTSQLRYELLEKLEPSPFKQVTKEDRMGSLSTDEKKGRIDAVLSYLEGNERKRHSYKHWKTIRIMERNLT